ncbi:hypothetical protein LguiA_021807 [Lonicera macranthoides]
MNGKQGESLSQADGIVGVKNAKSEASGSRSESIPKKRRVVSNKNAPYTCYRCGKVYQTSQSYAAHWFWHYRADETVEQREQRKAFKRRQRAPEAVVPESVKAKGKKKRVGSKEGMVKEPAVEISMNKQPPVEITVKNEPF